MPSWENVIPFANELKFPDTLFVECAEGHDLGNNACDFEIECSADGVITYSGSTDLPRCRPQVVSYTVSGRIRNAVHPTQGVSSATLVIDGQTITVNAQGYYTITLPA